MNCWNCGTANQPDARFCIQCGAPQARACPVCNHANPAAARFCSNCGSPLADAAPGAGPAAAPSAAPSGQAAAPVAERRLVSVLFVDLVGSTSLAEDRDPEETRELLSRYFELARRTVEGHGGTIEKFIGDAVMAVWGAPTAHEDDAERAVRAALELLSGVGQLQDGEVALQARAGVLTGEVAVTIGAEGQGMVAGDLVNTASRLQGAAEPGTVLVGEATMRAASNAVSFEPAGEHLFKGKTAPVAAWRAVAVVARRGGQGRASTLEPPFVGREDELQQLKDLFEATGREQKPRLVTVIGQAGIGKSRLAWEYEKYLDGVVETAFWHEGRSPAYGQGISYWALAEMVRRRAEISEGDDPQLARERLSAMLREFSPDPEEQRWIEPRLAGLLGLADLPADGREELFSAWRTLFERIAQRAPTIMVFVDLHWADDGLLDFVEDLLMWARSSAIFVVALARPELLERRPNWGSGVRSVTRINLEPLSDEQVGALLEGLLPGLAPAAVEAIVERAEGIPLYAVETVRMLLDTGAVVADGDRYRVQGDLSELAVPETLQALIAARLDANRPEDRALLQDAAVLGLTFRLDALAAVHPVDADTLEAQLDRILRRQLLVQDNDPRSPERGQYRFVQALLREVAYQSLARRDRRARHLAAARYFEALGEGELAGVLATHYVDAFHASQPGPEADAVANQARIALLAAADRAVSLHSHRNAISYLGQALTVTDDPAERGNIHERIAVAGEFAGSMETVVDAGSKAVELYRQVGDRLSTLRAATVLGRNLIGFHMEDEAASTLRAAIDEASELGDVPELGATYAELARAHMLNEEHEAAIAAADRALVLGSRDPWIVIEALITKGTSLGVVGRAVESEATLRGAIHLADRHGLVPASLRARNNLAGPLAFVSLAEAIGMMREGWEMATRYGHRLFAYQFLVVLLDMALRRGEWDAWLSEADEFLENESVTPFYAVAFHSSRAVRVAIRGDLDGAERIHEEVVRLAGTLQSQQLDAYVRRERMWLRFIGARWEEVLVEGRVAAANSNFTVDSWWVVSVASAAGGLHEALDESIAGFDDSGMPGPSTDALQRAAMAGRAARQGDMDAARALYQESLKGLRDGGELLFAHLGGLLWSRLARSTDSDALQAGEAAEEFFAQRGASQFVKAFDAAFVRDAAAPAPGAQDGRQPVREGTTSR
jgi:class 3 adenylate cyclase/tetratricopeptide (TPR) repeat protein